MTIKEKARWKYARKRLGLLSLKRGRKKKDSGRFDARNSPFIVKRGKCYYKVHPGIPIGSGRVMKVPMVRTKTLV